MKKLLFLLLFAVGTTAVKAQFARLDRYPLIPTEYEAVYVDVVRNYAASILNSSSGQYFGQFTPEGEAYGFGTFYFNSGSMATGAFYNGILLFGIKQNSQSVEVGTEQHHVVYDLQTSEVKVVVKDGVDYLPNAERKAQWKYVQISYANGAKYVGETVNGRRDGYGIYYYADGDFYYGRFADDKPVGYGAVFKTDNRIVIQNWDESLSQ